MWDNLDDCQSQLGNTIVRIRKLPVRIDEIYRGGEDGKTLMACVRSLTTGVRKQIEVNSLNVKPVPLGYTNLEGTATYLMRRPLRRWKHGLDAGSLITDEGGRMHIDNSFDRSLARTIKGDYPTLATAIEVVRAGLLETCAFSRTFAISKRNLIYKGAVAGKIKAGKPILSDEYEFLAETLGEVA